MEKAALMVRRSGKKRPKAGWMYDVEYEVFGCPLSFLSAAQHDLFDRRHPGARPGSREQHLVLDRLAYREQCEFLFAVTKSWFDWAPVAERYAEEYPIMPTRPIEKHTADHSPTGPTPTLEQIERLYRKADGVKEGAQEVFHRENFGKICGILDQLQQAKGERYRGSWRKRGHVGVFHNLARKWDRIENAHEDGHITVQGIGEAGDWAESLVDTLADKAVYAILWLSLIQYTHPQAFDVWLQKLKNEGWVKPEESEPEDEPELE